MIKFLKALLILSMGLLHPVYSATPKLIIQIVVDQLREDLIHKHQNQFGNGGFNYLVKHSFDYHNAHHPHANTTTCAGHATIATGSYPAYHGIIDNEWYDRVEKKLVYCTEDSKATILPTQHTKKIIPGQSPKNMAASTLSDEIILAKKGKSFALSIKDRAAITLAGHAGKAFWFDKTNGGMITSSHYYSSYPKYVVSWNAKYQAKEYLWKLSKPRNSYVNVNSPTLSHQLKNFNSEFPHKVTLPTSELYFKELSRTPRADEIVTNFAIDVLRNEQLGQHKNQTDYLAISYSSVDVIGHEFGPNSLEAEDNLIRLDNTLATLLKSVDATVGLNNTLIVLTADHGVGDSPSYLKANGIPKAKTLNKKQLSKYIHSRLLKQFFLPAKTLIAITPPYIYLDHDIINARHLNKTEVVQFLANELTQLPDVFRAIPLPVTGVVEDWLGTKISKMYFPKKAGDIYLVQPPYQFFSPREGSQVAHGSPWEYDSYIPLLFSHPSFKHKVVYRSVYSTDIAPTLAQLLMIKAPSAAVGSPLIEVLTQLNPD